MSHELIDATMSYETLKQRDSYPAFIKKFADIKLGSKQERFRSSLEAFIANTAETDGRAIGTYHELMGNVQKQHTKMLGIADFKNGKWVLRHDDDMESFSTALGELNEAQETLTGFLRGEEVNGVEAPKGLTKAYKEFEEALGSAEGIMNGWFGRARVDGIGKAFDNSMKEMKFWADENKEHRALGFSKCTIAAGGAAAIAHGALASKNSDGEERNGMLRLCETLAGIAAVGAAVLFGKAR